MFRSSALAEMLASFHTHTSSSYKGSSKRRKLIKEFRKKKQTRQQRQRKSIKNNVLTLEGLSDDLLIEIIKYMDVKNTSGTYGGRAGTSSNDAQNPPTEPVRPHAPPCQKIKIVQIGREMQRHHEGD